MASIRRMFVCKNTQCKNEAGKHRGYKKVAVNEKIATPCKHCGVPMALNDNYVTRITKDGKTHTKYTTPSKKTAAEYLGDLKAAARRGELFPGEERLIHWEDACVIFEKNMEARLAEGKSRHTVRSYRNSMVQLTAAFGNTYLQHLTRAEVEAWRDERKKVNANGSINNSLIVLGILYNLVCDPLPEEKYTALFIAKREMKKVKPLTKGKGRNNILENEEEFQVLLDNCTTDTLRHFVLCILNTGLRHGDALMLKTSNVDFKNNRIVTTVKGGETERSKEVSIPLTAAYRLFLEAHISKLKIRSLKGDYLFPSQFVAGTHINTASNIGFKTACKRSADHFKALGRPEVAARFLALVPHDLRHSFATRFIHTMSKAAGATVAVHILSEILGHSSAYITARYCHSLDDNSQAAMAAYGASMDLK